MADQTPHLPPLAPRAQFLADMARSLETGRGWAASKICISAIHRLNYPLIAARAERPALLRVVAPSYIEQNLYYSALFPPDVDFYQQFNELYAHHLRQQDYLGIDVEIWPRYPAIIEHYQLAMPLMNYLDQEPDRSSPADEANCYLPFFRGRRLLLISSTANLLRRRATREVFEQVWAKTGKPWFEPARVEALEFPYGYTMATHRRYANSSEQLDDIVQQMANRNFDVALIAAAGLAVPLASVARQMGKVAIDLGGHLQVLFGVAGKRWRQRAEWQQRYLNPAWIDLPAQYIPPERLLIDKGDYF